MRSQSFKQDEEICVLQSGEIHKNCKTTTEGTQHRRKYFKHFLIIFTLFLLYCFVSQVTNQRKTAYFETKKNITRPEYALIKKYNTPGTKRLPNALIIGAKKCGTRALLEFIRIHPDVRACSQEMHFFDRNFDKGLTWYRKQMVRTFPEQIMIEKTPSYFVEELVPRRVKEFNKDIKLILIVRNPVTRAISDYQQSAIKYHGKSKLKTFEESIFTDVSKTEINLTRSLIHIGMYSIHFKRWLKYFPRNQICVVDGDNLIKSPYEEIATVQDFLEVKKIIVDKHFYYNETKGFFCLKKGDSHTVPHCLGRGKGRQHPVVADWALNELYKFYEPYNKEFYQLTGINFNWERHAPAIFKSKTTVT